MACAAHEHTVGGCAKFHDMHDDLAASMQRVSMRALQGINRLGRGTAKPGTLRPTDPNRFKTEDFFSVDAETDPEYIRRVVEVEQLAAHKQGCVTARGGAIASSIEGHAWAPCAAAGSVLPGSWQLQGIAALALGTNTVEPVCREVACSSNEPRAPQSVFVDWCSCAVAHSSS